MKATKKCSKNLTGKQARIIHLHLLEQEKNKREEVLLVPYTEGGALNQLRGECPFLTEPEYLDDGIRVKVLIDEKNYGRFSRFIIGQEEK